MSGAPDVHEGFLDAQGLANWKRDLDVCAQVLEVRIKSRGPNSLGDDPSMTLDQALECLSDGAVGALQVRYRFEGDLWCDTILPEESGARVIRTRM